MQTLLLDKYGQSDGLQADDLTGIDIGIEHSVSRYEWLDAIDPATLKTFDLFILQVNHLEAADYELLQWLHTKMPETAVLVIAAQDTVDDAASVLELGVVDYFTLPLNQGMFAARLKAIARKHEQAIWNRARLRHLERLEHDLRSVILPLGIALSAEKNFDHLLERMLIEAKNLCNADAGTLYLHSPQNFLSFAIMRTDSLGIALGGTTGKPISFNPLRLVDEAGQTNYRNVATSAALSGQSINIPDIYNADDFDFSATKAFDELNNYRSISILTVPLKDNENQIIGVLQLLNAKDSTTGEVIAFDAYQQLVVESLASQAAIALNNQMLLEGQKSLFKLQHELQTAQQIQNGFLPSQLPDVAGWEIASCFRPARKVAGDFYDVFALQDHKVGFIIADVCDKGVPAALFMALIRSLIRAFSLQQHLLMGSADGLSMMVAGSGGRDDVTAGSTVRTKILKSVIALTNDYIIDNHSQLNMFATLFYGILDARTGTLSYINAGHNPPIIVTTDGAKKYLKPTDPAVGMIPAVKYRTNYAVLEPGDTLVTFTDGVTDARDVSGELYGEERFEQLLAVPIQSAANLVQCIESALMEHVGKGEQFDDITMLVVRRKPE